MQTINSNWLLKVLLLTVTFFGISCSSKKQTTRESVIDYVVTYYPDSTIKEIVQKENNLLSGKSFKYNEDGTKLWEFNYVSDSREGPQYTYDRGKLILKETFQGGLRNGWTTKYTGPCGGISEEGQYKNDKLEGLWYEYYGKELLEIGFYKGDSLIKVVYRNKNYSDRNKSLPNLQEACCCKESITE